MAEITVFPITCLYWIQLEQTLKESITITDNRSGESIEIPITDGGVDSSSWTGLLPGIWFKDEGFAATAVTNSEITYIDGAAAVSYTHLRAHET